MLIYLILINALSFLIMLADKYFAKNRLWRVPESTLFALAIVGGSVGTLCSMYLFRHKTRHISFTLGIPAILFVQLCLLFFYYK